MSTGLETLPISTPMPSSGDLRSKSSNGQRSMHTTVNIKPQPHSKVPRLIKGISADSDSFEPTQCKAKALSDKPSETRRRNTQQKSQPQIQVQSQMSTNPKPSNQNLKHKADAIKRKRPRLTTLDLSHKIDHLLSPILFPRGPDLLPEPPSLCSSRLPGRLAELQPPCWRKRRFRLWRDQVPPLRLIVLDPRKRDHLRRFQTFSLPSNPIFQRGVHPKIFPRGRDVITYENRPNLPALKAYHNRTRIMRSGNDQKPGPGDGVQKNGAERKKERERLKQHKWVLEVEEQRRWRAGLKLLMAEILDFQARCMLKSSEWKEGVGVWLPDFHPDEIISHTRTFREIRRYPGKVFEMTGIERVKGLDGVKKAIKQDGLDRQKRKEERRTAKNGFDSFEPNSTAVVPAVPKGSRSIHQRMDMKGSPVISATSHKSHPGAINREIPKRYHNQNTDRQGTTNGGKSNTAKGDQEVSQKSKFVVNDNRHHMRISTEKSLRPASSSSMSRSNISRPTPPSTSQNSEMESSLNSKVESKPKVSKSARNDLSPTPNTEIESSGRNNQELNDSGKTSSISRVASPVSDEEKETYVLFHNFFKTWLTSDHIVKVRSDIALISPEADISGQGSISTGSSSVSSTFGDSSSKDLLEHRLASLNIDDDTIQYSRPRSPGSPTNLTTPIGDEESSRGGNTASETVSHDTTDLQDLDIFRRLNLNEVSRDSRNG